MRRLKAKKSIISPLLETTQDELDNLLRTRAEINPRSIPYFDKLTFRMSHFLTCKQENFLQNNAAFVDTRTGHPIRASDKFLILTVINPNDCALKLLASLSNLTINYAEIALDIVRLDELTKWRLRNFFDTNFVQPWHGKHEIVRFDNATYTGQRRPGHWFTWYCDRPSKCTGDVHCFHLEGRHQGVPAVRNAGIEDPVNLLTFDHIAYWRKNLTLFELNFERLGRWHENRRLGRRRKRARVEKNARFSYNYDLRTGSILFRMHGDHQKEQYRSLQKFVDQYGRGPFLRRLNVSALLPKPPDTGLFI